MFFFESCCRYGKSNSEDAILFCLVRVWRPPPAPRPFGAADSRLALVDDDRSLDSR